MLLLKLLNNGKELNPENLSILDSRIDLNMGILRKFSCQRETMYQFWQQQIENVL